MSLRIRKLKLTSTTINGNYGAELEFPDGLVLLHLHNTRGKSTALKSIIYCLGLERMFGQVSQAPLTPAMTTRLKDGDKEWDVVESWVLLQIENAEGAVATLRRKAAGEGGQDRKVIDVWECPMIGINNSAIQPKSYYARDPGSAQNEQGIAFWLAKFIGWDLPKVSRHDGGVGILYIECLLSLFFVEQGQGWTTIQAGTPRIFGIRQVEKKAVEFILDLDACQLDVTRELLEQEVDSLKKDWSARRDELEVIARSIRGALRNLPRDPQATWPPLGEPYLEAFQEGLEVPLNAAIELDKATLVRLDSVEIPTADDAAKEVTAKLNEAYEALNEAESVSSSIEDDLLSEQAGSEALETRLQAVIEDLVRNKDAKKLEDLGATGGMSISRHECPTCHQDINDTLLDQRFEQEVMGLDENIAYLAAQKQTLDKMKARTDGAIQAILRRRDAVASYVAELRLSIRSLKRTLVSAGLAPSEAAIRDRIVVDDRLLRRVEAQGESQRILLDFPKMAARWAKVQARLKTVKGRTQSDQDRKKLRTLSSLFTSALEEFGFESFLLDTVSIDNESYRPKREGFDLAYAVSASDNVRIIAAYITSLFETAREEVTNHPGLLILDEPRQQNMQWPDFAKILGRLSGALQAGQQVIVATSDRPDAIRDLMAGIPHTRVDTDYNNWLLKRIPDEAASGLSSEMSQEEDEKFEI